MPVAARGVASPDLGQDRHSPGANSRAAAIAWPLKHATAPSFADDAFRGLHLEALRALDKQANDKDAE